LDVAGFVDSMKNLAVILGISILLAQPSFSQAHTPHHCSVPNGAPPPYPDSLKGSGIQGSVAIEAIINDHGCTESVKVVGKLHPELDEIAQQAVTSWKFNPAMKDGRPVKVTVRLLVAFKESDQQH
jgi:TonB family protein